MKDESDVDDTTSGHHATAEEAMDAVADEDGLSAESGYVMPPGLVPEPGSGGQDDPDVGQELRRLREGSRDAGPHGQVPVDPVDPAHRHDAT